VAATAILAGVFGVIATVIEVGGIGNAFNAEDASAGEMLPE
jgi:hypothetical protein